MVSSQAFRLRRYERRGSALRLTALLLIPLLAMAAFAIDYGRIGLAKAELQRAADAAALAGAHELFLGMTPAGQLSTELLESRVRAATKEYASINAMSGGTSLVVQDVDLEVGYLADPHASGGPLDTSEPQSFNTVRVHLRRDAESNGSIPMSFARVLGKESADVRVSATATFVHSAAGFKKPSGEASPGLPILPFALDLETWQLATAGDGQDDWKWDAAREKVTHGGDGIGEFNLYPQDTGSAANRGTVNIGTSSNSTSHIARQILLGVSQEDWEFHDGSLTFDENGELLLNGNPGISAGFKDELDDIRGLTRIVPIFSKVEGEGGNAIYTIVEWGGIRILDVDLTGKEKRVIVQAAEVVTGGVVAGPRGKSKYVFSRVWLAK